MFDWLLRKKDEAAVWLSAIQSPNEVFPFPMGMILRAKEELVIELPKDLLKDDESIDSILICNDNAEFGINTDRGTYFVILQSGMTMSLTRSSQAILAANDGRARKFEIQLTPSNAQNSNHGEQADAGNRHSPAPEP